MTFAKAPLAFILCWTAAARGGDTVGPELEPIVREVGGYLRAQGQASVFIGKIAAAAKLSSSGGSGVKEALKNGLQANGLAVRKNGSSYALTGKFGSPQDSGELELNLALENDVGAVVKTFKTRIKEELNVASLAGLTTSLPADRSQAVRKRMIKLSLDSDPEVSVRKTRVSSKPDSKFAVEVLVKKPGSGDYAPLDVEAREGNAFVKIEKDDLYAVRVVNDADFAVACTLTVDGLNSFVFSENKGYSYYIIPARSAHVLKGWHISNQAEDSFKATEYAQSAAAEFKKSGDDIGMITASFRAAWPEHEAAPADEGADKAVIDQIATGRGPRVDASFKEVLYKVGALRDAVSVRYAAPASIEK